MPAARKTLFLKNPHSVEAALTTRPTDVLQVRVNLRTASDPWKRVATRAAQVNVSVTIPESGSSSSRADHAGRQGGAEASVREKEDVSLEQLFAGEKTGCGVWLALDCLQDPHNVGAIFRSAAFFGVRGIVFTRDRSAPISGTVYDTAAGGLEAVPFAVVANLAQALTAAKDAGVWVLGTSEHASQDLTAIPRDRDWLIVVGNEETGLRRLTIERCDELCRIAPGTGATAGLVTSLNVATATAIVIAALTGPA